MPTENAPDAPPSLLSRARRWLWTVALLVAVCNGLVVVWRMPRQRAQADTPFERIAETTAAWLNAQPANARTLLLLSHQDNAAIWFNYRLNYFIYPRRHDLAWDAVPPDAPRRYDRLLAVGQASTRTWPGWTLIRQTAGASLLIPQTPASATHPPSVSPEPTSPASPAPLQPPLTVLGCLRACFGIVAVIALGALLLRITTRRKAFAGWGADLALAHLVGSVALAWLLTLTQLIFGRLLVWPVYALLAGIGILDFRFWILDWGRRWKSGVQSAIPFRLSPFPSASLSASLRLCVRPVPLLLAAALALGVFTAVQRGWLLGLDWDGYAIWQFKAKAFFLDDNLTMLRDAAHFRYAHLDYPLLVPLQSWWTFAHLGAVSDRWAQMTCLLFYFDLLILFYAAAKRATSSIYALLGTALLSLPPTLTQHAVSGFADLQLAAYILMLAVLLSRIFVEGERDLWPLAGWMLAGALLTKNEGLLTCGAALLITGVYLTQRRRDAERNTEAHTETQRHGEETEGQEDPNQSKIKNLKSKIPFILIGAAAYLPWWGVKRAWHLVNDLLEENGRLHLTGSLLAWRLGVALRGMIAQLLHVGPWFPAWGLLFLLFPVGLIISLRRRVAIAALIWTLAGLQLLGYTGIYLITPYALPGHLASSVSRLWLHLIPTLLLAALLGCFAPSETENPSHAPADLS